MSDENRNNKKHDLNDRLLDFAIMIIKVTENIRPAQAGLYLIGQLTRSGLAQALHHGEARDAESGNDFIHKIKGLLKEWRESFNSLRIIERAGLSRNEPLMDACIGACNQLIAIFVKSVETARKNKVIA